MSPRRCPGSALPLLYTVLAAALLLHAAHAASPPDPSSCNPASDIPNPNVNLTILLSGYEVLSTFGTDYGINSTCLNNALLKLASCEADLFKVSGCCSQSCWDAVRDPTLEGDCLNSLILGACQMAKDNVTVGNMSTSSIAGLIDALFFTYNDCVEVARVPYTCATFAAMLSPPSTPSPPAAYGGVGYGGYGGVGYGGYGGVGYGGYGGVGYGGYGGVGYGGYGGVGYGGYFFTSDGGMGYAPYTPVRRQAQEVSPTWKARTASYIHRRLSKSASTHRRTSVLASVLRRLRQH